ncbi:hypothetical protein F5144DRAFT_616417 [Chaetomium tenue]|uniref:Uncharacterized protein n=1 Tax=Chaetomium tenue TaxID=1854479 RepID=A0ACB7NW28_9PEZI|nr:hypothetical protein F5144DRAFT_616417 [Chaetomium globosum]
MRISIVLGGLVALATATGVSAKFLHDSPPATRADHLLVERQEATTTVRRPSYTPDPWQCITESITQVACLDSNPNSWCGFTTAAPASILSDFSTYLSSVVSFWTANSETVAILSTSCPVAWSSRIPMIEHEWFKRISAHASCYLEAQGAHAQTQTDAVAPTPTASGAMTATTTTETTATTSEAGVSRRGQALEAFALIHGHPPVESLE